MIPVMVSELKPGDIIKFVEGGKERTVTQIGYPDDGELRDLHFMGYNSAMMPDSATVFAVQMYRVTEVPCLVCKKIYKAQFDRAKGGTPRAVLCKGCDDTTTAEVLRRMKGETT